MSAVKLVQRGMQIRNVAELRKTGGRLHYACGATEALVHAKHLKFTDILGYC
jgi:hypothetical protein